MKLDGWNRLFIVLGVAHLIFVAAVTWAEWPVPAAVYHDFAFYSRLPDDVRASILNVQVLAENERAFIQEARTARDVFESGEMPNGHLLLFRKGIPFAEMSAAGTAYWGLLEREAHARRVALLRTSGIWWATPLAFAYAVGLAVRWVYRGFRGSRGPESSGV